MTKFTASRLSEGNNLFPASITIDDDGLEIRIPGFLKNQETFIAYEDISGVAIETPLVGYSSSSFRYAGTRMSAHGFAMKEVKAVKEAISNGKKGLKGSQAKVVEPKEQVKWVVKEKKPVEITVVDRAEERESVFENQLDAQESTVAEEPSKLSAGLKVLMVSVGGIGVVMLVMFYVWII